jgi:hypothetical protein
MEASIVPCDPRASGMHRIFVRKAPRFSWHAVVRSLRAWLSAFAASAQRWSRVFASDAQPPAQTLLATDLEGFTATVQRLGDPASVLEPLRGP